MPELPPPPDSGRTPDPWPDVSASLARARGRLGSTGAAFGGLLALIVLGVVAWMAFAGPGSAPPPELELPTVGSAGDPGAGKADAPAGRPDASSSSLSSAATDEVVVVHVAGAVVRPGVYRLAGASRFADALDAAGGPAPDAEPDGINLAALLSDGERVYVPRRGEVPPAGVGAPSGPSGSSSAGAPAAPIDLNTATAADLEALPGVGPATAAAIVEYRQQQGRFRSVDELLEVRGIGEAKLAAIRSKVRVR